MCKLDRERAENNFCVVTSNLFRRSNLRCLCLQRIKYIRNPIRSLIVLCRELGSFGPVHLPIRLGGHKRKQNGPIGAVKKGNDV